MGSDDNTASKVQAPNLTVPVLKELVSEFKNLKSEIQTLRAVDSSSTSQERQKAKIHFSLDRLGGERKPYILRSEGTLNLELKLSSIRAAIFLVLLLDLQDRLDGGPGINNILEKVIEFYCALDPAAQNTGNLKSVTRVGLYRFEFFLEEIQELKLSGTTLLFKPARPSLDLKTDSAGGAEILVTSTDQKILLLLEKSSRTSPLARLRKHKSMYIPSGEGGWDQLFLEFFDHPHKVRNISLFYRFALPTYPDSLLKAIGASDATLRRKNLMIEGYRSKRVEFVEFISRETLWDLISLGENGGFKLYPKQVTEQQVKEHLENIIYQLNNFENYNLVLTDAPFPFILGVVEIIQSNVTEMFTLFYRQYLKEHVMDRTCFALSDAATTQSVQKSIVGSVVSHPSTTQSRREVLDEISQVLQYFLEKGPKK
jgi:hypothetical protein